MSHNLHYATLKCTKQGNVRIHKKVTENYCVLPTLAF